MTIDEIVQSSRASQNALELKKVLKYIDEIHPKVILEIGAWRGFLMEVWQKMWPEAFVFGIEKDSESVDPELAKTLRIFIGNSGSKETLENVKTALEGRKIDFLFIDGDHTYDAVKKDFQMYEPLVRNGGIVGFHDIALNSDQWRMAGVDVSRFWTGDLIAKAGEKYLEFWDQIGKGTGTGLWYKK